jgi:hypothetical protein
MSANIKLIINPTSKSPENRTPHTQELSFVTPMSFLLLLMNCFDIQVVAPVLTLLDCVEGKLKNFWI